MEESKTPHLTFPHVIWGIAESLSLVPYLLNEMLEPISYDLSENIYELFIGTLFV